MQLIVRMMAGVGLCILLSPSFYGQIADPRYYDPGAPVLTDLWVDPVQGEDGRSGATRAQALRTLTAAWNRIPRGETLTGTGYRIRLVAGRYPAAIVPGYFELRRGTREFPVMIQSADGPGAAVIEAFVNISDCRYLYLLDLKIEHGLETNVVHLANSHQILLRGMTMDGKGVAPQVLKVNQADSIYVEGCEIFGASGSAVDFVATRNGRVIRNRIHDAGNWAMFIKGGSAYFQIEANELYNAARGGFTAGQTTGFEFMESPWLHYEAYDVKFVNNLVHDTGGGGMAVSGGYAILLASNTLYRVGRDKSLIEILYGQRVCSGDTTRCTGYLNEGGWGTTESGDANLQPIPNRNVFIYNNLIYNPPGFETRSAHLTIFGPQAVSTGSNIPSPAFLDQDLHIRGNIVWNGAKGKALGTEYAGVGCQPANPTCNDAQLRAENAINAFEPQLLNPTGGDFRPVPGGNVFTARTVAIPDFEWKDAPARPLAPVGNTRNLVYRDRAGVVRSGEGPAGAYVIPAAVTVSAATYRPGIAAESLAAAFGTGLAPKTVAAVSAPLPTILDGTSVRIIDSAGASRLAPLLLVSQTQVNYLIPAGTAIGSAWVVIENWNGSLSASPEQIIATAPGVFTADASGKGWAAASVLRIRADGTQTYEPVTRYDSGLGRIVPIPIDPGGESEQVFLILYGTGIRHRSALSGVSVKIGGIDCQVFYAGAQGSFAGLDQVNVRLPRSLAGRGEVDVALSADLQPANITRVSIR